MSPAFFRSFRAGVASELAMEELVAVDASGFLRFSPVEVEICDEEDVEGFILNDPADRFIACGAGVNLVSKSVLWKNALYTHSHGRTVDRVLIPRWHSCWRYSADR